MVIDLTRKEFDILITILCKSITDLRSTIQKHGLSQDSKAYQSYKREQRLLRKLEEKRDEQRS